jgi:hypothetical protein
MLVQNLLNELRFSVSLVSIDEPSRRRTVDEREYITDLEVGDGATSVPRIAQVDPLGRRQKVQKKLLRLHSDQVHVEPRRRLVANVNEHIVVDDEIVNQTFEKRIVENEQRFRQIANRARCYDRCVEVPEYGEECIRVVAVAVPNVVERVAGRAPVTDVVARSLR